MTQPARWLQYWWLRRRNKNLWTEACQRSCKNSYLLTRESIWEDFFPSQKASYVVETESSWRFSSFSFPESFSPSPLPPIELIRKTWNVLSSVRFETLWGEQPIVDVDIMKWIILAFFLISLSTLSHSAEPTPADYGGCPEEEFRGERCDKSRTINQRRMYSTRPLNSRHFILFVINETRSDMHHRFRHHWWMPQGSQLERLQVEAERDGGNQYRLYARLFRWKRDDDGLRADAGNR